MKFLSGVSEVTIYDVNDNTLVHQFKDIVQFSQDWESDIIYIDVAFVPDSNIKLCKYILELKFKQFADTEPPNLAPRQIDDYIERYCVEYVGYWIPKAKNDEQIVFRHKFYVAWQDR